MRPENSVVEAVPWMQANGVRRVLDLGCGVGRHSIFLALNGFTVYALDASANGELPPYSTFAIGQVEANLCMLPIFRTRFCKEGSHKTGPPCH